MMVACCFVVFSGVLVPTVRTGYIFVGAVTSLFIIPSPVAGNNSVPRIKTSIVYFMPLTKKIHTSCIIFYKRHRAIYIDNHFIQRDIILSASSLLQSINQSVNTCSFNAALGHTHFIDESYSC